MANALVEKMRRTWSALHAPVVSADPRRIDRMVKQNLPPLMGRRDAAFDYALKLVSEPGIFSMGDEKRWKHYRKMARMFQCAVNDTESVVSMLSSPDTIQREKNFLTLLTLLDGIAGTLDQLGAMVVNLGPDADVLEKEFHIGQDEHQVVNGEDLQNETELNSVNLLRIYCTQSAPRVARYRAYALKSFSKPNAERYQKAHTAYSALYADED